jgi:putative transposase
VRDLYSRYLLAVAPVANTSYRETRRIFRRLFARYGLPRVIRCDRGSPFCGSGPHGLTRLSLWWHRLGIRVEFVNRQRRLHNNEHEQMHQILQKEVASQPMRTRAAQVRALRKWQRLYNYGRPHESLGMRTPASRYRSKPGSRPRLRSPRYPAGWLVHHVKNSGHILVQRKLFGIGRAFGKLPVGLKPITGSLHHVYFDSLLLGELDLVKHNAIHFLPTTSS